MTFPQCDKGDQIVVVGGGIAGLATALYLSPMPVTVLTHARLGLETATAWAQGGLAAAIGPDDSPELHAADTLTAGAGLTEPDVARAVARSAPACIEWLERQGVFFDRGSNSSIVLGLEAAHGRRRIVHAGGDGTGQIVLRSLIHAACATSSIRICEKVRAVDLVMDGGTIAGLVCTPTDRPAPTVLPTRRVVLATGGIGGLYAHTTNPLGAVGSGLALAARAGAVLRDIEFVQFHPTAIATGADPMSLATEALRGEGARLVNEQGERFMADVRGAELAPRDVVARAIFAQLSAGHAVFLDARAALGKNSPDRFPSVAALCRKAGLDPGRDLIPVRPAAHYHMGRIKVDHRGRTSIDNLWACGEVAATGLHGANRLASNSLIEALAYARWIAEDILGVAPVTWANSMRLNVPEKLLPQRVSDHLGITMKEIRSLMTKNVGVVREATGLQKTVRRLARQAVVGPSSVSDPELVALFVAMAALARNESRGAHFRIDHPSLGMSHHNDMTLAKVLAAAATLLDHSDAVAEVA